MAEIKLALLSVFHKEGIVDFARALIKHGYSILSSGGTAGELRKNGVEVMDVADYTGYPEILGHRVVTLHPKIHGGILARLIEQDEQDLKKYMINRIHLVCVDVYPVWDALAEKGNPVEDVLDMTDIGGPTMLRAAAKNFNNGLVVVCNPDDRQRVIDELEVNGEVGYGLRMELAYKVFDLTSRYDASIRKYLGAQCGKHVDSIFMGPGIKLAYAENRRQNPSILMPVNDDDPLGMHKFEWESGHLSYTSTADGSQVTDILCLIAESYRSRGMAVPYIAIAGKHGNPCGVGVDWVDERVAIAKALMGDRVAVMGGELVTNFYITEDEGDVLHETGFAERLTKRKAGRPYWGLDIVLAPKFDDSVIEKLGKREKRRLLSNPALADPKLSEDEWMYRQVRGGFLKQRNKPFILTPSTIELWSKEGIKDFESLVIAWAVCWSSSSNTVTLAKDKMLIGIGCGQQDRIACVRLCLERANRAGHRTKGSVFASDAFFPYAKSKEPKISEKFLKSLTAELYKARRISGDKRKALANVAHRIAKLDNREGPELLIDAGCVGGVVPADGNKLNEVEKLFRDNGLSVAFVHKDNRGFAKH